MVESLSSVVGSAIGQVLPDISQLGDFIYGVDGPEDLL